MSDTGDESGVANSNAHEISAADAAASAAGALLQTGLHPASEAQMQAYATALRRTIPQVTIRGM